MSPCRISRSSSRKAGTGTCICRSWLSDLVELDLGQCLHHLHIDIEQHCCLLDLGVLVGVRGAGELISSGNGVQFVGELVVSASRPADQGPASNRASGSSAASCILGFNSASVSSVGAPRSTGGLGLNRSLGYNSFATRPFASANVIGKTGHPNQNNWRIAISSIVSKLPPSPSRLVPKSSRLFLGGLDTTT